MAVLTPANNRLILTISFLAFFDFLIWGLIVFWPADEALEVYFLDVGQGDSQLVVLPGNVKILIDGGPDNRVLDALASVLRPTDRYIDLVVLSHPQADHFIGLIGALKRYSVGAFISNGQDGKANSFNDLENVIRQNGIPAVVLAEKDRINYQNSRFDILSPSKNLLSSAEPNDAGLVMRLASGGAKILFTADIGANIEKELIRKYKSELNVDVLKVGHHGSKFSSSEEFLTALTPKIAVIEVGRKNQYRHPTGEALSRLASAGAKIFRTDKNGTVKLTVDGNEIKMFSSAY